MSEVYSSSVVFLILAHVFLQTRVRRCVLFLGRIVDRFDHAQNEVAPDNGTQYYLYSGTQYASMYVGNYS